MQNIEIATIIVVIPPVDQASRQLVGVINFINIVFDDSLSKRRATAVPYDTRFVDPGDKER
jgi:hypothetical protein